MIQGVANSPKAKGEAKAKATAKVKAKAKAEPKAKAKAEPKAKAKAPIFFFVGVGFWARR